MNGLVQHDLNTLEIMIMRMIWIINMKNMTMIDMQSQKSKEIPNLGVCQMPIAHFPIKKKFSSDVSLT